eukprot:gene10309-10468_t
MAYYCRLYAIKKGLEIPKPAKEISGLIKATFAQCEKDKPAVQPNEETDRVYCENFALTVFRRADKVDRAARADINTCKAFYAAAIFLQVLEQFLEPGEQMEDMAPDLLEKIRYALWRAAEIRKALREGRQPAPPPDVAAQGQFEGAMPAAGVPGQQLDAGAAVSSSAMDSITSSTDDFLSLPKPPSTVPPAGSTGLMPAAAAAGPRYRPGSKVWVVPSSCSPDGLSSKPEEGTVGMVVAAAGGPGGQAVYKVALRDRLEELTDGQLAPAVAEGGRLLFVSGIGQTPEPASVIAFNRDSWPVTYLLQLDSGSTLDTDGAHVTTMTPGDQRALTHGGQALSARAGASAASAAAAGAAGGGWFFPAPGGYQPSPSAIAEAQKYSKYAASSLAFDDVSGAIKYLTDALKLLTTPLAK